MSEHTHDEPDGHAHTHPDGTTHDHAHVDHEHDRVGDGNEHTHEAATTHSHDHGAESKRPGFLARLFGVR